MRLHVHKKTTGRIEFGIIYGGIALLILGAGRFLPILSLAPGCVFRGLTGVPCPTCGATRSVVHLSHGDILSAFAMNPLTTLCLISAVAFFFTGLVSAAFDLPRVRLFLTDTEKHVAITGAIILLFVQWVYLVILL